MAIQFLNNVNADSGVLYVDAVNDRVGIGTTSPEEILHIQNTGSDTRIQIISDNTRSSTIFFGDTDDDNAGVIEYHNNSDSMRFFVNASETMRITSVGKVGIGTTSPAYILDVKSSQNNVLRIESTATTGGILFANSSTTDTVAIQSQGDNLQFRVDNGHINLKTNTGASAVTRMRITNDGEVGIGTTAPSQKLHVDGSIRVTGGYYDSNNSVGASGQVLSSTGSATDWVTLSEIQGVSGSGTPNYISKWDTASSIQDSIIFDNGTNVGIGTASPTAKLDVDGEISIGGDQTADQPRLTFRASDESKRFTIESDLDSSTANDLLGFRGSTTDNILVLKGNGNVGIGTTSPSAKLHVNGQTAFLVTDGNETGLSINNGTYIYKIGDIDGGENQSFIEIDSASQKTIFNNTNVGIGTTSPDGFLHIDGMTSSTAAIVVEAAGSGDNVIMEMQNNSAAKRMTLQYDNSNINFNITDRNDDPIITFRESGNIGIGLETPTSALEMSGTLDNTSSKLLRLTRDNQGSGPAKAVGFYSNSGERGSITVSNFATAYNTSSDYRLKENVIPIEDGINRLMSLKPCRFNFISEEQVVDGFLAHEAQNIVPEAISGEKDQIDEDGNEVYQGIDQAKLVPLLTAALQEAIKRIEILEQKNK